MNGYKKMIFRGSQMSTKRALRYVLNITLFKWPLILETIFKRLLPFVCVLYLMPMLLICPIMLFAFVFDHDWQWKNVLDFSIIFLSILPFSFLGPFLVLRSLLLKNRNKSRNTSFLMPCESDISFCEKTSGFDIQYHTGFAIRNTQAAEYYGIILTLCLGTLGYFVLFTQENISAFAFANNTVSFFTLVLLLIRTMELDKNTDKIRNICLVFLFCVSYLATSILVWLYLSNDIAPGVFFLHSLWSVE